MAGASKPTTGDRAFLARRLRAQRVLAPAAAAPYEVVADLLAVQAQDYAATKWAVGLRLPPGAATEADIEAALAEGSILRTHVMRWTWQLVAPADVRWMLAVVSPRLVAGASARDRELELDAQTYRRANAAIERALRDGAHLARSELAEVLERAKISPAGQRLSHILAHAELAGVIVSGAPRGRQTTHALLDLRAPDARPPMPRAEALAEIAVRYFRTRGPATDADFAWWAGLPLTEARAALAEVRARLVSEVVGGVTYWHGDGVATPARAPDAHLVPAFDEYLVAYKERSAMLDPAHVRSTNAGGGLLAPCIVVDGRVVGTWRRELLPARQGRGVVSVAGTLFAPVSATAWRAIERAARRYGAFLGREVVLEIA